RRIHPRSTPVRSPPPRGKLAFPFDAQPLACRASLDHTTTAIRSFRDLSRSIIEDHCGISVATAKHAVAPLAAEMERIAFHPSANLPWAPRGRSSHGVIGAMSSFNAYRTD